MLFAPSHNDTQQFVKFITTRLGRMKAWGTCNSLDWVTCYPLHYTFAYIVYRESRTLQVVYIHVHYGVHNLIYIGVDSRLIDLSLCCIICSQIKKDQGFGCQTRTTDILSPKQAAVCCVFPRDSTAWLENRPDEWTIQLVKNRCVDCKNQVFNNLFTNIFFSQPLHFRRITLRRRLNTVSRSYIKKTWMDQKLEDGFLLSMFLLTLENKLSQFILIQFSLIVKQAILLI